MMISFLAMIFCVGTHEQLFEAIGNMIGKDLQGISIDYEAFARGVKEGSEGKESSMTLEECLFALAAFHSETNLKEAEDFLARNLAEKGINSLEKGKVLFRVNEKGTGEAVQAYDSPLVRYEGKMLNGQIFVSSEEEVLSLDTVIEGLRVGIEGMLEGEKRTIYIHPDFGFGGEDFNMPNALLIFEVEVLKANVSGGTIASELAEEKPL